MWINSIVFRLFAALIIVAGVAIGLVGYLANHVMTSQFNTYLSEDDAARAQRIRTALERYYEENPNWRAAQRFLTSLAEIRGDRLLLTDGKGTVLLDSQNQLTGYTIDERSAGVSLPVTSGNRQVAVLHVLSYVPGHRFSGGMGGMMDSMMGNAVTGPAERVAEIEQNAANDFLGAVNRSLWLAGLGTGVVAALLSLVFAETITGPLKRLRTAAGRIAKGDLSQRVNIRSGDEIGQLATSFNVMAESLAKNEQLRRELTADIAHELRTPLTVIQGSLEAMLDGVAEPNPERLASLHEETMLLSRLITDLRDLSLAEAGQLKLQLSQVDLAELIKKVVTKSEEQARQNGVSLSLDGFQEVPPVQADAQRIEQVLFNLLSNALRHTPASGEIVVSLRIERPDRASESRAQVAVRDTGSGIPPEDLPRIFDRFYRVDKSRSRTGGGSGIGLAIVKQLVELHGGKVWAESTPGQGSTFSFSLPLKG